MKVSAPQFMSTSAPPADAPAPTPDAPTDPAAPPPPAEPPKQAVWPEWFAGVDKALIVFALLFAFLMASFAARNSDVYRHLAAGKRLLDGTYSLGSDPFSYTGADAHRPWVNQEWLFDLSVYAAYSADPTGALAVVLKAVLYAAAFGVLLWFRRPGQAGWPWATMIAAGALVAAAGANLRPVVFGMLFLALLLLLLLQGDWTARRGRTLALVGGLCWLWGGFDSYAIVGPLLMLVMAVGGLVQQAFDAPAPAPTEPRPDAPTPVPVEAGLFDTPPAPKVLVLAAAVGLLGVLLNPTFLIGLTKDPGSAVAQLVPFELAFGTSGTMAEDPEFRRHTYSLLSNGYWASPVFGLNFGSAGLFLLVLVGAMGLALGVARVPPGLMALWFGTLLLCFASYRFVPLFAVAAVPLVAGLLNGVSARLRLGTVADGGTKGLLLASRLGRIVTVPLFLVMLAATIPGWLHLHGGGLFQRNDRDRRLDWRIVPDESLTRGVKQLQRWRAAGDLDAGDRGLLVSPEFGDYAAWFADKEPVFVNTRFRFHSAELGDLIQVRNALLSYRQPREQDAPPPPSAVPVADKYGAVYVALGRPDTPVDLGAVKPAILSLAAEWGNLRALWYLDGRTAIIGRSNTARARALGDALHLDIPRLAFAPQSPLPEGPTTAPPDPTRDGGWLAAFVTRPPAPPVALDDVNAFNNLSVWVGELEDRRYFSQRYAISIAIGPWPIPARDPSDAELAIPLLLNRTARQAIAQAPDEALPYFALAVANSTKPMPEVEAGDTRRERLTAFARYAARTPPATCPPAEMPRAVVARMELFGLQLDLGQWDVARETVKKARETVETVTKSHPDAAAPSEALFNATRAVATALSHLAPRYKQVTGEELPLGGGEFEFEEQVRKSARQEPPSLTGLLKKLDDAITAMVSRQNEQWDRETRGRKPAERVAFARTVGLPGKAADLLKPVLRTLLSDPPTTTPADAGVRTAHELALSLIGLELELGRLEEAATDLTDLENWTNPVPDYLKPVLAHLKVVKLRRQGSYAAARDLLEELYGGNGPKPLTPEERRAAVLRPVEVAIPLTAAVGLLAVQMPAPFQPPKDATPPAAQALAVAFRQRYVDTLPFVPGHVARRKLFTEAQYYYQRGVLALLGGDMPVAAESFRQAFAPQGVPLDVLLRANSESGRLLNQVVDVNQVIELDKFMPAHRHLGDYVRLIERYKNEPPRP